MDVLDVVLVGATLPILIGCIVWFVRLNSSQQKGERSTLRWRDLDLVRKTVVVLIFAWITLNLYLTIGNELAALNVAVLPLSSAYSIYRPTLPLATASSIVGVVVLFSIRFPKRSVPSSSPSTT